MIFLLMGVSGSGKTTVGRRLADRLGWKFLDADDFHPPENVRKMAAGIALDDRDRLPWLRRIREVIDRHAASGDRLVVTCSALKHSYRKLLLEGASGVQLVYLKGSFELIEKRLRDRRGHFMPAALLRSQFEALEEPSDAVVVDASPPPDEIAQGLINHLKRVSGSRD